MVFETAQKVTKHLGYVCCKKSQNMPNLFTLALVDLTAAIDSATELAVSYCFIYVTLLLVKRVSGLRNGTAKMAFISMLSQIR